MTPGRAVTISGMSRSCFLALGALGGAATTTEVRIWLERQGEKPAPSLVRQSLRGLTRRKAPLAELTQPGRAGYGEPNHWKLTEYGRHANPRSPSRVI